MERMHIPCALLPCESLLHILHHELEQLLPVLQESSKHIQEQPNSSPSNVGYYTQHFLFLGIIPVPSLFPCHHPILPPVLHLVDGHFHHRIGKNICCKIMKYSHLIMFTTYDQGSPFKYCRKKGINFNQIKNSSEAHP